MISDVSSESNLVSTFSVGKAEPLLSSLSSPKAVGSIEYPDAWSGEDMITREENGEKEQS